MDRPGPNPVWLKPLTVRHAAGVDPAALARAVVDPPPVPRPEVLGEAPQQPLPVFSDRALEGQGYPARMEHLLDDVAPELEQRLAAVDVGAVVILPPGPHRSGARWDRSARLEETLSARVAPLRRARWWQPERPVAPLQLLRRAADAVAAGRVPSVLLGGVDACAAPAACADPRVRRQCAPAVDGPAAADAAAFVLLHNAQATREVRLCRIPVGGPPEDPTTWQRLLQEPLGEAEGGWAELHGFGATPAQRHVWANTRRLVPWLRRAVAAERYLLWRALGFAGGATLPLQLAAAAALLLGPGLPSRCLLIAADDGTAGAAELQRPGAGAELSTPMEGAT